MPKKPPPPFKPPKSLGACADLLYSTREERLLEKHVVDALDEKEKRLKAHIIDKLPATQRGVAGKVAKVLLTDKSVPRVTDWEAFYAWVKKKNRFDLLQRRLSEDEITKLWDAGIEVPGVEEFKVWSVSVTKI